MTPGTVVRRVAAARVPALLFALAVIVALVVGYRSMRPVEWPVDPVRIAVIGDTLSAGPGDGDPWPTLLAAATGAAVTNVSVPAAGYFTAAGALGTFAAQVSRAGAAKPQVIVVVGGLFDVDRPEPLIRRAAGDLFAAIAAAVPAARLIVVGPIWSVVPVPDSVRRVDRAVSGAASDLGVPYVPLVYETWLTGAGMVHDDGQPTEAGQQRLAGGLADALRAEGVRLD
ncbi:SGNH/GDSL hydrolase family protein [Skermania piniformis]|uniref:SGNH/GDSL hydrolase family protein n=1 Tax=Skermania pinensis TaxID=39122 RepID=A0ABX8SBH3_9ACTN|nr:GDSL-type esterase/lipase family protein [Skermania piniformis]QXQ15220.1 SGNH/GDSL hydrolase family protein [Skermania piniformis]